MHFQKILFYSISQRVINYNLFPVPRLAVKNGALCDAGIQHFFQAYYLGSKLQYINFCLFRSALLILNWVHLKKSTMAMKHNAIICSAKLNNIARATHTHCSRMNRESPNDNDILSLLRQITIMCILMHQFAFHCMYILLPLLLNVNQRPLPPAKSIVLDA